MKPCFGYTRVSTLRQGDGASLEAQKDAITGFASQNNLQIIQWFEERETASRTGRPVFEEMLTALRKKKAEGLVIHKIDRSARNFSDWARLDDVARSGTKVYFAADSLDFDSRGGRLLADIQMALAADYSRNLSLEVKKGIYGRVKNGFYPFRAPIGYLDTGGGKPKAIDPIKGPLVKKLFELYASREYSITTLTSEMRRQGLTGYRGTLVVRRNVETILRNPFYCGKMRVGGKLYDGAHEPLVSTAQFRSVQSVKQARYAKKSTKHRFLFRGLFKCATCNGLLTGEWQKAHIYYRCHTKGCPAKTIREERIETGITAMLQELQVSSEDRTRIAEGIQRWFDKKGSEEVEKSLRLRIADARSRQDRVTDLLVEGAIDQQAFQSRKDNIEFELQHLREDLAALESRSANRRDFNRLLDMAMDLVVLFQAGTDCQKRRLIRNCLSILQVQNGEVTGQPAEWLRELPSFAKEGRGDLNCKAFSAAVRDAEEVDVF